MKSLYSSLDQSFKNFIGISFFVHIGVFFVAIFLPYQFVSKPIAIKEAIRVDMVGLPDIKAQQKAIPKPKKKKSSPKKVVKKKPKKRKKTSFS